MGSRFLLSTAPYVLGVHICRLLGTVDEKKLDDTDASYSKCINSGLKEVDFGT